MIQSRRMGGFRLVRISATIIALTACSQGDRDRAVAETDSAADRAGRAVGTVGDTLAGRIAGREYTNGELVAFLNAHSDAEIAMGQMAQTKATDTQVRDFARRIASEHQALKTEATSTAQRLNLTPSMPDDDEDLMEDHQEGMRDLNGRAKGKEFDEEFLEHEINMHRKMLDEVEDALGRNRNQEIRPLLERARDGIRGHLEAARELEKKFGS